MPTQSKKVGEVQAWTALAPQIAQQAPAAPWLKALVVERIVVALEVLLGIVRRPSVTARLAELPKSLFDAGAVGRLPKLGPALWALHQAARTWVDPGRVPAELRDEATERRDRMKVLVFHHFAKDEVVLALAEGIGSSTGYAALASDLERLTTILAPRLQAVRHDKTWFDPQDVPRGKVLAYQVLKAQATEVEGPPHHFARLLSLVHADYEELREAVHFVTRRDEDRPVVPALTAAARVEPRKKAVKASEEAEGPAEEGAPDAATSPEASEAEAGDAPSGSETAAASTETDDEAEGGPTADPDAVPLTG